MNSPLVNLIILQFKEFYREPGVLFWAIIFPLGLAGILGLAFFQQDTPQYQIAIVQNQVKSVLEEKEYKTLKINIVSDFEQALLQVKRGQALMIVEEGADGSIRFHFDTKNEGSMQAYRAFVQEYFASEITSLQHTTIAPIAIKGARYIDFLIPGLLALGIMNGCIWGIGWNLIDYRIKKLMRRLVATPMKKSTFLLAQVLSRAVIAVFEAGLLLLFALLVFGVELQGSWALLILLYVSGMMAFSGIAILMSSRASHTQVGNGLINGITLPMTILSGIFFSYQSFPDWAVALIKVLPLTLLSDSMRSLFNEAASIDTLWPAIIGLWLYGLVCFAIGLKVYKWY